jgi:integration host factor subunit beta
MVKSDLIIALGEKVSLPFKDVEMAVNQMLDCMSSSLANGMRIEIRSFGSFRLNHCPPRRAHNPKTGEKVATIDKFRPHFKPGKELRERVNEAFLEETEGA